MPSATEQLLPDQGSEKHHENKQVFSAKMRNKLPEPIPEPALRRAREEPATGACPKCRGQLTRLIDGSWSEPYEARVGCKPCRLFVRWEGVRAAPAPPVPAPVPAPPPPSDGSTTCRSCGAAVVWAVTAKGKRVPLDPAWHVVFTEEGDAVRGRISHFATCPHAAAHRRKGGA